MPSKYFSEVMLGLASQGTAILRPVDVKRNHKQLIKSNPWMGDCHIYAICKRPKISLKSEALTTDESFVYGTINFHTRGQIISTPFRLTKKCFSHTLNLLRYHLIPTIILWLFLPPVNLYIQFLYL